MSTRVGYRIRGIEPPDLYLYPDSVKLMFWGWAVPHGLEAKHRELSQGLDKDGKPLRPLKPESIKHRKSEVGPTDPHGPPLQPSHARSRVHSLLTGRAHTTSAEFWWRFDSVTGKSFAAVLSHQAERGRDVFGLSPKATAWVKQKTHAKWEAWKRSTQTQVQRAAMPGKQIAYQPKTPARPVPVIARRGRTDLENMDAGPGADLGRTRRAIRAGMHTGFRRLNAHGERWKPLYGDEGSPRPTVTQRKAVEKALAVRFRPDPRASSRRDVTVLVDVQKLDDALAADPSFYVAGPDSGAALSGRYRQFERFLLEARARDSAVSMPRLSIDSEGRPAVVDGRHRLAVFRDQGAAVVPVTVHRDDAKRFREAFGASRSILGALVALLRTLAG